MIGLWLVALSTPARGERPITLGEVMQAAADDNGTLVTSRFALEQARGAVLASKGIFDPFYRLEGLVDRTRTRGYFQGFPYSENSRFWSVEQSLYGTTGTGTTYSLNFDVNRDTATTVSSFAEAQGLQDYYQSELLLSVTQELLRGIRFRYNIQNVTLAEAALTTAELAVERDRQEALYAAALSYWTWAYQYQLHAIALEAVGVAQEALRVGDLQVERGQLAPVEATRLEAALVQAQQDAIDAENLAQRAANTMLTTIGQDPSQEVSPATSAGDVPAIELDPDRAVEVALKQNYDLAIVRQDLDTSGIQLANAKHGLLPSLSVTAEGGLGAQRCTAETAAAQQALGDDPCTVGNAIDAVGGMFGSTNLPQAALSGLFVVPLGNRAARGGRAVAQGEVYQNERIVADMERTVAAQTEEQVRALQSARQRMDLADANLRLAEETLQAEEALATAGRAIQKDVLEARTEVSRTRAEAAKARTDYRLAQALLLKLQGQLTAEAP